MERKYEALIALFKEDPEAAQTLLSCSAEGAVEILNDKYHLEFTVDELNDVAEGVKAGLADATADELTEELLVQVVGGGKSGAYYAGYYIGKTIIVGGVIVGIGAGLVAIGVVSW